MKIVAAVLTIVVMLGLAAWASVRHGVWDVGADVPHAPAVSAAIAWVRERAIERAARDVVVPDPLATPERLRRGAGNYDAMCVACHLAPGRAAGEWRAGMQPQPPDFTQARARADSAALPAARLFWITRHGIVGSGMPSWRLAGVDDETLWAMVALIDVMPDLSPEAYRTLVAQSGGHDHAGASDGHGAHRH